MYFFSYFIYYNTNNSAKYLYSINTAGIMLLYNSNICTQAKLNFKNDLPALCFLTCLNEINTGKCSWTVCLYIILLFFFFFAS